MAPRKIKLSERSTVYAVHGPSSSDRIVHFVKRINGKLTWFFVHEGQGWGVWAQESAETTSGFLTASWNFDVSKHQEEHLETARIARAFKYNTYERARELMIHFALQPKYVSLKQPSSKMAKGKDILTSPDSILVDADLVPKKMLAKPTAWEHFDESDKAEIRSFIPAHIPVDGEGLPTQEWLKYSPDWQQAVRLHQADLKAGRMDPEWQAQAAQAMEERAEGKFDDWKEKNLEEYWGQKAKPPVTKGAKVAGRNTKAAGSSAKAGGSSAKAGGSGAKAGGSSAKMGAAEGGKGSTSLRFPQMVRDGVFEVGDVLSYSRLYPQDGGASSVLVEKRVKIVAINTDKGLFTCAIPPGTSTLPPVVTDPDSASSQNLPDNCITYETNSNIALATKIIDVDGRIDSSSLGRIRTAWEDLQCYRGGNLLGSLFDLRELHYLSLNT